MRRPGNDQAEADPDIAAYRPPPVLPPVISTVYRDGPMRLALFSTLAQFGSAEDISLADLRIELNVSRRRTITDEAVSDVGRPGHPDKHLESDGCHDR